MSGYLALIVFLCSRANHSHMHIIFYGPEGSGKGTQAAILAKQIGYPVLTSGDLVRDAAANDKGIIGDVVRQSLQEGKYVADSEMQVLWKWRLKEDDAKGAWIMDGFPRNLDQARFLDDKIDKYGYSVEAVVFLKLSEDESMTRLLKRARPLHDGSTELHDSPERIKSRLALYKEAEKDVLEYYNGKIIEIDASKSVDEVSADIFAKISPLLNK